VDGSESTGSHTGADLVARNYLAQFGIKGMKWGIRRSDAEISAEAEKTATSVKKLKKSGLKSLTNEELQTVITRMGLEQNFNKVRPRNTIEKAGKLLTDLMSQIGKEEFNRAAKDGAAAAIREALKSVTNKK
jgi:predicted Zn-dependent peptidase